MPSSIHCEVVTVPHVNKGVQNMVSLFKQHHSLCLAPVTKVLQYQSKVEHMHGICSIVWTLVMTVVSLNIQQMWLALS